MCDRMAEVRNRLRVYLCTDVLLSLLEGESRNDFGENVSRILEGAADGRYQVLVSEHTVDELLRLGVPEDYVDGVLRPFLLLNGTDLLVTNSEIVRAALKMSRSKEVPFMDTLHAIFAQRNNALVITRDLDFTNAARSLVGVMTPEELG
jgi:predicted nucleic acid-binding protein